MTKTELKQLVDRIYASWNQIVPASNSRTVYEAWFRVLEDLTVVDVEEAIDYLVIQDRYMPRPGTVRRLVIEKLVQLEPAPAALEAWQQMRSIAESINSGAVERSPLHPCLQQALSRLGGVKSLNLHTNGDRDAFVEIYTKVVHDWEMQHFRLNSPQAHGV